MAIAELTTPGDFVEFGRKSRLRARTIWKLDPSTGNPTLQLKSIIARASAGKPQRDSARSRFYISQGGISLGLATRVRFKKIAKAWDDIGAALQADWDAFAHAAGWQTYAPHPHPHHGMGLFIKVACIFASDQNRSNQGDPTFPDWSTMTPTPPERIDPAPNGFLLAYDAPNKRVTYAIQNPYLDYFLDDGYMGWSGRPTRNHPREHTIDDYDFSSTTAPPGFIGIVHQLGFSSPQWPSPTSGAMFHGFYNPSNNNFSDPLIVPFP